LAKSGVEGAAPRNVGHNAIHTQLRVELFRKLSRNKPRSSLSLALLPPEPALLKEHARARKRDRQSRAHALAGSLDYEESFDVCRSLQKH